MWIASDIYFFGNRVFPVPVNYFVNNFEEIHIKWLQEIAGDVLAKSAWFVFKNSTFRRFFCAQKTG